MTTLQLLSCGTQPPTIHHVYACVFVLAMVSACGDTISRGRIGVGDTGLQDDSASPPFDATPTGDSDSPTGPDAHQGADGDSGATTADSGPGLCAEFHLTCGYVPNPRFTGWLDCGRCELLDLNRSSSSGNDRGNRLIADPSRGLLYATTQSRRDDPTEPRPGPISGAVVAVDPETGAELGSLHFEVPAQAMAMTDDASRLFVTLDEAARGSGRRRSRNTPERQRRA